jgi:hypothetical protein
MESLKQLVAIYKEIDVRMHAIYANVIHHRLTFEQGSAALQLPRDAAVSYPRYSPTPIGHDCHNLDPVAIRVISRLSRVKATSGMVTFISTRSVRPFTKTESPGS